MNRISTLKVVAMRSLSKSKIVVACLILLMLSVVWLNVGSVHALNWGDYGSSGWEKNGHNWVVLNALELLRKDGYDIEADIVEEYLEHVINGVSDADAGSAHALARGYDYGISEDNLYDMMDMYGTGLDGGGLAHFFNPWDHHGVGPTEDLWEFYALGTALSPIVLPLLDPTLISAVTTPAIALPLFLKVDGWRNWQGKNAAEGAGKNFNRAVNSWNRGEQLRAMYFLGYVLHLLGDVAGVPHHSASIFLDGHSEYESFVENDISTNPDYYRVDRIPALSSNYTQFSGDDEDHGIYLEDLHRLSDGIYIAGDTDLLVDTESDIADLRYGGHVTQLSNPVHQFIDFAAHESIEWYPLANDGKGDGDFDNWWEIYNYIETRDLKKKSKDEDHSSRLIFHFEGVDSVVADFEFAWDNKEAIDMSNWYYKKLGYVKAYSDYIGPWGENLLGTWVDTGPYGPEPEGYDTLQILTIVYRGLKTRDPDVDGWQLSEIRVHDKYGPNDVISDPLLGLQPDYYTSAAEMKTLPLLDDPLPSPEPARRIAAVHSIDLASKLIAGMIKHFFDRVGLPRGPPETTLHPVWSSYIDDFGNMYVDMPWVVLTAKQGRMVWSSAEGKYVLEGTGDGLYVIGYQIDYEDFTWVFFEWQTYIYEHSLTIDLPDDELPHTIRYYSTNWEMQVEPLHTQVVIVDYTRPTTELIVGEPSVLVDDVWHITHETPITLTASDHGGSGVREKYYAIYSVEQEEWVVGGWVDTWWLNMRKYENPFTFKGHETVRYIQQLHRSPEISLVRRVFELVLFSPLSYGTYLIYYRSADNMFRFESLKLLEVELVDSIEGVDVSIDPYASTVQPGSSVDYNITIRNRYLTTETYDLTLEGLEPSWFTLSQTSITIGTEETANVTLAVSVPYTGLIAKDYSFTVTATLQGSSEVSDTADALLALIYQPELPPLPEGGLAAAVLPKTTITSPGTDVTVDIQVVNNENFDDLIQVALSVEGIPEQYQADPTWFSWPGHTVFVPAGGSITIPLTITIPADTSAGYKFFRATATSMTRTEAKAADAGIIRVT